MVEYRYDAWGRATYASDQLPISNWLCLLNPFRYRGYIYDSETGMYYLRSRYYNPEIGRFLNADDIQNCYSSVLYCNLYCYCLNNPAIFVDSDGRFALVSISLGAMLYTFAEALVTAAVYTAAAVLTVATANEVADLVTDISQSKAREREISVAQSTTVSTTATSADTNQKNKQSRTHLHHVVAKADWRAAPTRKVLAEYGINVWTDARNLVAVSAEKHVRLHTNAYYSYVNSRIIIASRRGGRAGVIQTLELLKHEILAGTILK